MPRRRILIIGATASIGLAGAVARPAVAGSRWSYAKCEREYSSWFKHHFGKKGATSKKRIAEVGAHIKALEKEHRCKFGFGRT